MADDDENKVSEAPVVVVGIGQTLKLDGQISNTDDKSRTLLPYASMKTELDSKKNKLQEKSDSKPKHLEFEEETLSDYGGESSVVLRNVTLAPSLDETMKVENKTKVPEVPTGPESSISDQANKMTSKHSKDRVTDEIMELKTPEASEKHSEWMIRIGDNAWNRKDYLDKVHLKAMNSSEMSIRGKQLERKTSIGPCALGNPSGKPNERPSGISISIPRKSSKNFTEAESRVVKPTGINLSKKSTSDLSSRKNSSSLQEREDMRPFTYFTHTTRPSKCNLHKDDHVIGTGDSEIVSTTTALAPPKERMNCFIKFQNRISGFFDKIKSVLN